ncbi:MAG: nucleotidyltransferase [Roseicyclus sp.]|nr:nucleotidyltransferase [Roseicyclus sp.]MBO6624077.1 nucleotidyltransferase [Roseicyclus sp.]MBO6923935.1 nucleotidyltransferase [Roseicyclus sp.]
MGIAATLFFSNDDAENCLAYRVRPSDEQREAQQERWNDLRDFLVEELQRKSGYALSSWLQGSYKFGTQIRPCRSGEEFDIDLGIYFRWPGEHEDGDYDPLELKDFVQEVLVDYSSDEANETIEVSEPKARCNRIHFDGDFHIDVPTYHLDQARDFRGLATSENTWEDSDPKAIYVWWKDTIAEADRPRARRMVRYLKMWAALNIEDADRPSSILLTVLAAEAYIDLDHDHLSGDDEYYREIIRALEGRLRGSTVVPNPINRAENLNRLGAGGNQGLLNALDTLLSIADRALASPTKGDSAEVWSEAFHHFFPFPEEEELTKDAHGNALALLTFDPQVSVMATVGRRKITGMNGIGPIPKGCAIRFDLANARDLPAGSEVSWTVRNSGVEAEAENDLGHRNQNGLFAEERSAYRGDQFMDVTVRLNGRTIGRRRVLVRISGLGMPMRNPKKKGWVQLRNRR